MRARELEEYRGYKKDMERSYREEKISTADTRRIWRGVIVRRKYFCGILFSK
jgi:hypothetical protein